MVNRGFILDVIYRATLISALAVAALLSPVSVAARDREPPPLPCPLTATLRVAGAGSLAGLQAFADCAPDAIIVAPASAAEYAIPRDVRIVPPPEPTLPFDRPAVIRVAKTKPVPPLEPAIVRGPVDTTNILAMRPISYRTQHDAVIQRVAERQRIDPLFLHAVITQESGYKATATSHAGARGLMQLMPATGRALGLSPLHFGVPEGNVDAGARLLRRLYGRYSDFNLALAAYNAGEGAVAKYGNRIPPYAETQHYVRAVMARYSKLVAEQGR